MQGVDVFCERCGTPQPKPESAAPLSAGVLARRVLDAVGITENQPTPTEDWLRLCLSCRGYNCPACWNEVAGVCQTCEPLPQPVFEALPEPLPEPVVLTAEPEPLPELEPVVLAAEPEPLPELEPVVFAEPEPLLAAEPEPVVFEREPAEILDPDPVFLAESRPELEPVVFAEPEPEVVAQAEPEPEPEVVAQAEPEPEPVVVAEPEPEPAPAPVDRPRMPVLPLPPPRPADAPAIPLPPLTEYPVAPQITFSPQVSIAASAQTSGPAYEAHMLLAPPTLPANAIAAGLRPCTNCRLTLSARAHFCRRCGIAQTH